MKATDSPSFSGKLSFLLLTVSAEAFCNSTLVIIVLNSCQIDYSVAIAPCLTMFIPVTSMDYNNNLLISIVWLTNLIFDNQKYHYVSIFPLDGKKRQKHVHSYSTRFF